MIRIVVKSSMCNILNVQEREENWRISPSEGIPTYTAEKDPHCPTGQIRKFNTEKKLKAQILAQRDKATDSFIKSSLDHNFEEIIVDPNANFRTKIGQELKSKVTSKEDFEEIAVLQKIIVRENLLMELHKLLKTQSDVTACVNEVVELVKALRFQTMDIIEDIDRWQQNQPRKRAFQFKGFNYLVKIRNDLEFLDIHDEIVEKFGCEFKSNPLAYRGGGTIIVGYSSENKVKNGKSKSIATTTVQEQRLYTNNYDEEQYGTIDGIEISRLQNSERIIQAEFNRITQEKNAGIEMDQQFQQQNPQNSNDVLNRYDYLVVMLLIVFFLSE
jgi:hypothetical protein